MGLAMLYSCEVEPMEIQRKGKEIPLEIPEAQTWIAKGTAYSVRKVSRQHTRCGLSRLEYRNLHECVRSTL